MAYVALPQDRTGYPESGAAGELRLLDLDSAESRVLAKEARTYFEHRAAVWLDDDALIHIDAEGRTVLLNVDTGAVETLIDEYRPAHGWLVDRTLSFATQGAPTFSPFDRASGKVRERPNLGGCQPYFAHHTALGVWVAGAGGPIRAFDLESRRQWPVVGKGDERLPADRRYLYFPMPSKDGRYLAWAASDGSHDHESADYDVFVAEANPDTLELLGAPWRVTHHKATDRFPDVWAEPLELGRHAGEAPFETTLRVPPDVPGDDWSWSLGDGRRAEGRSAAATWPSPGRFGVTAEGSGRLLHGTVHVAPAMPPEIVSADVRPGRDGTPDEIWVRFDEPVEIASSKASFESGPPVTSGNLRDGGAVWVLRLGGELERPSRLTVRDVADRAGTPNTLAEAFVVVTPALWPSHGGGLVFLWQDGDHANRVIDPRTGLEESTVLESRGRAWLDRRGAAVLRGGSLEADMGTMERLFYGVRATNELSLELTFTAALAETARPAALFGFGGGGTKRNMTVAQEGDRLTLRLNTPSTGDGGDRPVLDLGAVRAGRTQHLVVSYTPGRLRAYLDGEETTDSADLRAGFFHWKLRNLRLGAEGPGPTRPGEKGSGGWNWLGTIEGVAVYDRALDAEEAKENHRRYAEILRKQGVVQPPRILAEMMSRSRIPNLDEIAPYREALAVFEYRVNRVLAGPVETDVIRVVHRVLLEGEELPIASLRRSQEVELELQPFDAQPQLGKLYISDDLPDDPSATLWWSDRIEP